MAKRKVKTSIIVKKEISKVFNKSISVPDGLVTNDKIRTEFFNHIKKSKYIPSDKLAPIWRLINNQTIIPVNIKKQNFLSKLVDSLKNSIVPFEYYEGTMGFYSGYSNRIYLLIDNMLKYHLDSDGIAATMLHELQHMQCHNFPNQFFNLHKDLFKKFYTAIFKNANDMLDYNLYHDSNSALVFCKYLLYTFDDLISNAGFKLYSSDYDNYWARSVSVYSREKMTDEYRKQATYISDIFTSTAQGLLTGNYWKDVRSSTKNYANFSFSCIWKSYSDIGYDPKKMNSLFGQELIFPSELISILSGVKADPKMFQFINNL